MEIEIELMARLYIQYLTDKIQIDEKNLENEINNITNDLKQVNIIYLKLSY